MKRVVCILGIAMLLFACEGDQGPVGPQGPPGPSGAAITYIYGVIGTGDYSGAFIQIDHYAIDEDAVTQFYVSQNSDDYAWVFIEDFQLTEDRIYVYDPSRDYLGFDYMIMIVYDSGWF
jgi:hypothetical protein